MIRLNNNIIAAAISSVKSELSKVNKKFNADQRLVANKEFEKTAIYGKWHALKRALEMEVTAEGACACSTSASKIKDLGTHLSGKFYETNYKDRPSSFFSEDIENFLILNSDQFDTIQSWVDNAVNHFKTIYCV